MEFLFYLLAALILGSACGVVLFRNPVQCALCLVLNLLCVAGIFAMLDAHFLAVVQVVVYAGAIMVLFVFVLMLLNIKTEKPQRGALFLALLALVTTGLFLKVLLPIISDGFEGVKTSVPSVDLQGDAQTIGRLLYSKYLFPFEAASILLMAALAGAIMLGKRPETKRSKE